MKPKFNLKNNPILTPFQKEFLKEFFKSEIGKNFFLTGGTALSAFYLAHRYSYYLDLFSLKPLKINLIENVITQISKKNWYKN